MASSFAAFAMLPDCATASRTCRSLSLIRRPIRSFQRMGRSLAKLLIGRRKIVLFGYRQQRHVTAADTHDGRSPMTEASMIATRPLLMAVLAFCYGLVALSTGSAQSYPQRRSEEHTSELQSR